jgi:hypothetical protein
MTNTGTLDIQTHIDQVNKGAQSPIVEGRGAGSTGVIAADPSIRRVAGEAFLREYRKAHPID